MKYCGFIIAFMLNLLCIKAEVITTRYNVTPGAWLCFRKEIYVDNLEKQQHLKIAADSKYWLWINGDLIVREGGLKRGPNPNDTYCDEFSEIQGLRKGNNMVEILVWYFGKDGFSHKNSPTPGIYFDLEVGKQHFVSDSTWKVRRHPSFYAPEGEKPNYRLPESNIGYDASKEPDLNTLDDTSWVNARDVSLEEAGWNQLITRPIPMWKDYGLKEYTKLDYQGDTLIIASLPYNAQVTPYIKLQASQGMKIDIRTDNYRGGSAPNVFAEYVTKEGIQEFEAYGWMNGHQVYYKIPTGVKVLDVKFRETGYDTAFRGSFSCNDTFYNTLWNKSLRTLYITMRDTYMDCPDRERSQWWGDVVNELGEAFYSLDHKSHLLTRKGIHELMNWQREDSVIYAPVPSGNWNQELPMQMLASVGYYGFWTYYVGTGDKQTIEDVYPNVRKYIHVWKTDENGLVILRKGGWTWGDWGDNKDLILLYNAWYSLALKGFEKMALLVGEKKDAEWASVVNAKLKQAFHHYFWNGQYYVSPEYNGLPDDRAQALAVLAGILPETEYETIRPFFAKYYNASPYMEKYVLESLCSMGFGEDALRRMKIRYKDMVESPLTTLWEGWGIGNEGFGGGSYNHAWSGGPLTILSQFFAGIAPLKPGFKEFSVNPQLGCLKNVDAVVPTKWGDITISIVREGSRMIVKLQVPNETTAHFKEGNGKDFVVSGGKYKQKDGAYKLKSGKWKLSFDM